MSIETFGERLLQVLKKRSLSQRRVAQALNVSSTAVNKWTKGGMIGEENLEHLATFLGVDKSWLKYGGEEGETPQTLRHINDFYLYESNEIVTWEWDILTNEIHYSDNVEQVYGINVTNNDDFLSLMTKESRDKLLAGYTKIIQEGGGAHEIEFKINQNGEARWIKSRAAGIKGPNGKVTKIVGISIDNSKQKREEIELKMQKSCFDFLLKREQRLTIFMDREGAIIADNAKAQGIDFFRLQSFLYRLVLKERDALQQILKQRGGELSFQEQRFSLEVTHDYMGRELLFLQAKGDSIQLL